MVKTQKLTKAVQLSLRDNTIRVSLEIKAKICHLFFTTKPKAEAVGFGRSLTRARIAQQHRGTLKVESEMRVYTKFIITLPKL
ncbi:ATP-binding protein [Microcoleus sp. N9_A2]|uniref:ATP-binding protein n=1 Tax=unclassified Microcoleus TaxID=2642155 RepID=UPI002FD481D7